MNKETKTAKATPETPATKPVVNVEGSVKLKPETKKGKVEVKQISWFDDRFYKVRYENDQKVEVEDYLPSVTTKLGALSKPMLTKWVGDLGNREANLRRNESADRGTRIHWAWETYCGGGVVIYQPDRTPLYDETEFAELIKRHNNHYFVLRNQDEMWNFLKLSKCHKAIKPYFSMNEQIVYDLHNRDAGTMDNLFGIEQGEYEINGSKPLKLEKGLYLFDAKTGNYVGNEAKMQLSAYWGCLQFMIQNNLMTDLPDEEIKGAIIGHTSATTKKGIEGFSAIYIPIEELKDYYRRYRNISAVWESEFGSAKPKIRQLEGYVSL